MKRIMVLSMLVLLSFSIAVQAADLDELEIIDGMVGLNHYQRINNNQYNGYYAWAKARYRPFFIRTPQSLYGFGFFANLERPWGEALTSEYSNYQGAIGFNLNFKYQSWYADLDFGLGRLRSEVENGLYQSRQWDNYFSSFLHVGIDTRRRSGRKLFPKTAFNAGLNDILSSKTVRNYNGEKLKPISYDNSRYEFSVLQEIYDWRSNGWRFGPGIEFGYGRDSDPQKDFRKIGLTFSFYSSGNLFRIHYNYSDQLGGVKDRHYLKLFYWRHFE